MLRTQRQRLKAEQVSPWLCVVLILMQVISSSHGDVGDSESHGCMKVGQSFDSQNENRQAKGGWLAEAEPDALGMLDWKVLLLGLPFQSNLEPVAASCLLPQAPVPMGGSLFVGVRVKGRKSKGRGHLTGRLGCQVMVLIGRKAFGVAVRRAHLAYC